MDANGTRFHLLLGQDDWGSCTVDQTPLRELWDASPPRAEDSPLAWRAERAELTLQSRLFRFPAAPKDIAPTIAQRRGAGRDRYGNWYWIDETSRKIRVQSSGSQATSHFWSVGDKTVCEAPPSPGEFHPQKAEVSAAPVLLSGLAVTEDHYLVVGVTEPAGLLIFDLHAGGAPRQLLWPAKVDFTPFDMAPRPGGGVWILDRVHRCYWELDRHFQVINPLGDETLLTDAQTADFQPVDQSRVRGEPRTTFPSSLSLYAASPLTADDPVALEALPDGTVLILDNSAPDFSFVQRYRLTQQLGQPVSTNVVLDIIEEEQQAGFHLVGHDFAFVPEYDGPDGKVPDRLYIVASDGNQSFSFDLTRDGEQLVMTPIPAYFPMRLFGGKALVAADTSPYYDFGDGWVPLAEQRRPRYIEEATLETPSFDSGEPDCVWHRLMLDACIPPETHVQVWSRAANLIAELENVAWQAEPLLYLRGDGLELPFVRGLAYTPAQTAKKRADGRGTWELLLQQARGRFLQLRLDLSGNERSTPRLRALRLYYPRFSYLAHYLPSLYRDDDNSASFLDRFLANLEGLYTTLEDKIAAVQVLFDLRSAPAHVLDWLASWFGVALDPVWDDCKRRLFLTHAMEFFQYRGTMRGLVMALRLALEECPDATIFTDPFRPRSRAGAVRIVEKYRTRSTPGVLLGDPTDQSGLREAATTVRWQPTQGGEALHQRYLDVLQKADVTPQTSGQFPLTAPSTEPEASIWQQFVSDVLGFTPSATTSDATRWQDFLARRYQHIGSLNATYGASWEAFDNVSLPTQLPMDGAPLRDWYQFEGVVLVMQRTAHRFTVLLPAPLDDAADATEHQRRLALALRLINLEKPAHTIFDAKFYWASFRVGEARLGDDTIVDLGSRAPQFLTPMVLGQGYLSENYLAPGHPYNVADRQVLGRDRLNGSTTLS